MRLFCRNLNIQNDHLDECIGGFLLDTLNQNLDPTSRLFAMGVEELNTMVKGLHLKLQSQLQHNRDSLEFDFCPEKCIIISSVFLSIKKFCFSFI